MKRREFITLLGGAAASWPIAAQAEQSEPIRRIGVLLPASADDSQFPTWIGAFLQTLGLSGWTIGRNVRIDTRWAAADADDDSPDTRRNWLRSHRTSSWLWQLRPWEPLLQATRTVPIVFRSSAIRSAPALSIAWRGRAATPPDSRSSNTA